MNEGARARACITRVVAHGGGIEDAAESAALADLTKLDTLDLILRGGKWGELARSVEGSETGDDRDRVGLWAGEGGPGPTLPLRGLSSGGGDLRERDTEVRAR